MNVTDIFSTNDIGSLLTDEQREDLKQMGEKFYGSIDMEKYKPIPTDEYKSDLFTENDVKWMEYKKLVIAINSGLMIEDITEDEKNLLNEFGHKS